MIVFDLRCGAGHRFEGWFASAGDFTSQQERSLLSCPSCGAETVERVPSATRSNFGAEAPAPREGERAKPQPPSQEAVALAAYGKLVQELIGKTEDVGHNFPEEARKIHYREAPERPIRGIATQEQHDALVEEGIPVARLPLPPGCLN